MKSQIHALCFRETIIMYISSLKEKIPEKQRIAFKEVNKIRKKSYLQKKIYGGQF